MLNIGAHGRAELLSNAVTHSIDVCHSFVHAQLNAFANDDADTDSISNEYAVVDPFPNDDAILDCDAHRHVHDVDDGDVDAESHSDADALADVIDDIHAHAESDVHADADRDDAALFVPLANAPPLRD